MAVGEKPLWRLIPRSLRTLANPVLTEKVAVEPRRDGGQEGARMGVPGVVVALATEVGNTLTCAWRTLEGKGGEQS